MAPEDLRQIIDIHFLSFPGFFLTFLGRGFLALLYSSIQKDGEGVVLVASSQSRIEGFVAGVMRQKGFYGRLIRKRKWSFAMKSLGALLRRPSVAPRLVRALRQPAAAAQASAECCLMSIAVRPESEGAGIGKRLVEAFCCEVSRRGAKAVCLTTDRDRNDRTNRFYERLGFRLHSVYVTPEGRVLNEYFMSLEAPEGR